MSSILFLNSPLDKVARGVVRMLSRSQIIPLLLLIQILESGSQASSANFRATRREGNWVNFVAGVESCASKATSRDTFDCIRGANSSEILDGFLNAIDKSPEQFGFDPTIDGPGGLYPDIPSKLFAQGHFVRLPFISGTTLDEGTFISRKIVPQYQSQ